MYDCGISFEKFEARHFRLIALWSLKTCHGLGTQLIFDEDLMVPDETLAWVRAIHPIRYGGKRVVIYYKKLFQALSIEYGIDPEVPYHELSEEFRKVLLYGSGDREIKYYMRRRLQTRPFRGIIPLLMQRIEDNENEGMMHWLRDYMIKRHVPTVQVQDYNHQF